MRFHIPGTINIVGLLFFFLMAAAASGERMEKTKIGEVFVVDRDQRAVIVSGPSLENILEGETLVVCDEKGKEVARVKVSKNNAATLKADFSSGRFSLIREKMDVFIETAAADTAETNKAGGQQTQIQDKQNDVKLVDPVQVKILDDGKTPESTPSVTTPDPKISEYMKRRQSGLRLGIAEFAGVCLPGSGLAHYIVKDKKGGLLVNALAVGGIGLYVANEYGLEFWYRKDSAVFYGAMRYVSMAVFLAGYIYDLVDAPFKWSRYNQNLKKELGIAILPNSDRGITLSLTLKY